MLQDSVIAPGRGSIVDSRRLRVLVFTTVFPNPRQPLHGLFVLERIKHLAELADIQVVAPIAWFRALSRQTVDVNKKPIIAIHYPRFWYIPKALKYFRGFLLFCSSLPRVARIRRTFDFDMIDAHFAYPDGLAAVLLGFWFRRPVCVTLRGTIVQWSKRPIGRWLCDWTIRHATRVIAVAESLATRARQGGVNQDRITTISNGVDTARFRVLAPSAARQRVGCSTEGRIIVSVGHISPRKGFHRLIRSLPRVLRSYPDARLIIVGGKGAEEDNTDALHALAERLGIAEKVLFVGAMSPDKVALWLAAADTFALASDFEGCPNVVLEAMACGRPVVATRVGDIERMVPKFAGILFDDPEDDVAIADCILAALAGDWDPQKIHEHVAAQSWIKVADAVLAQWRLALESSAQSRPRWGSAAGASLPQD